MFKLTNYKVNCLSYWYPKLVAAGIPTPKTIIIHADDAKLASVLDGKGGIELRALENKIRAAALSLGKPPYFLRTGQGSDKHSWKDTCFLADLNDIQRHIYRLVEWSHIVDIIGLPTDVRTVREMLPVMSTFTAFNGFPVSRERRCFVRDGKQVCAHPYWPPAVFSKARVSIPDWRTALAGLNNLTTQDDYDLRELTEKVGRSVPGSWSVDWLYSPNRGWVCTDMAVASHSYHWPGCKKAKILN
jgi:hypothetical protein